VTINLQRAVVTICITCLEVKQQGFLHIPFVVSLNISGMTYVTDMRCVF